MYKPHEGSRSLYIARAVFLFLKHKNRPVHFSSIRRLIQRTVDVEINTDNVTKFAHENKGMFARKNYTVLLAKDVTRDDLDAWITTTESLIERKGSHTASDRTGDGVILGKTRRRG